MHVILLPNCVYSSLQFFLYILVFSKMLNYRISSNKRRRRLLTFETVRWGVY